MARASIAAGLLLAAWCAPAAADIFGYTDEDGAVHLSNVPDDSRYSVYVQEPVPVAPQRAPATAVVERGGKAYAGLIADVAAAHGLHPALLHAVVTAESAYNPAAVSPKGAIGLMQLMPATARRYGAVDARDPRQNLTAGARYLNDLLRLFNQDLRLALAAYNAGEEAVQRHGNAIPPFRETQRYVPHVLDLYRQYQRRASS